MTPQLIPTALILANALCLAFGLLAWLARRPAAAVAANGTAMGLMCAGSVLRLSFIHSNANTPDWSWASNSFMRRFVSSLTTLGPRVMSPYCAVFEIE